MLHVLQLQPLPCYKFYAYLPPISQLGNVTNEILFGEHLTEKEKALGSSYSVTEQQFPVTAKLCPQLPSLYPDDSLFHINQWGEETSQPKLPSPHYKWERVGNTSVFSRFLHHNAATSTFGKGGPSLLGHSQQHAAHCPVPPAQQGLLPRLISI